MSPERLRAFLGKPKKWKELLEEAQVTLRREPLALRGYGWRWAELTHQECRRVMEAHYRRLGEWKQRGRKT